MRGRRLGCVANDVLLPVTLGPLGRRTGLIAFTSSTLCLSLRPKTKTLRLI